MPPSTEASTSVGNEDGDVEMQEEAKSSALYEPVSSSLVKVPPAPLAGKRKCKFSFSHSFSFLFANDVCF